MNHRYLPISLILVAVNAVHVLGEDHSSELVKSALARAGDNATELRKSLDNAPEDQKEGVRFLVAHMPLRDLHSLSADFLLKNVRFAYQAWNEATWKDRIPKQLFLNDVLPYASINERRDDWREDFYKRFKPLVADASSPTEAAVILNQKMFNMLNVRCAVNVTDRYAKHEERENTELTAADTTSPIDVEASLHAVAQLKKHLEVERAERPPIAEREFATVALTREHAQEAERLLWKDHVQQIKQTRANEMKAKRLTSGDLQMPFSYTVSGDKPKNGRSLYISLHGGGGAPKQVNDRQWENQKRLYRVNEGVYLAPRAATNTWNLWHQGHIDGMFDRLIENLIVFEGVDPNRVYLLGYSAGGDGVYQLAPRMADRLAGAAMMAGHPNEASPLGLRNVAFTIHVGGNDSGYNRNNVARQWGQKLDALQREDPAGYVHWTKIYEGKSHWLDRQDAAALPWMAKHTRNPLPKRIVWRQDDVTHARFYWLAVKPEEQRKGVEVRASMQGQQFDVQADGINQLIIRVNDRMLNLEEDVAVTSAGKQLYKGRVHRSISALARTLAERGDPASVYSGEVVVTLTEKTQ